jgi:hypothetical protein
MCLNDPAVRAGNAAAFTALTLAVAAAALAGPANAADFVLSPTPGRTYHGPARVVVAASDHTVTARLNGRALRLGLPSGNRRRGLADAADGLRRGRNVLVVRRRRLGRIQTRRVTFRVSVRKPLAGGRDREIVVGARATLDGRASQPRPRIGFTGRTGRHLTHRWRLVRAPERSRLARLQRRRARGRTKTKGLFGGVLSQLDDPQVSFVPDVPGTYVFALRVDDGVPSGETTVSVSALPPKPLLPLQTLVRKTVGGTQYWGIQVGDTFYPGPPVGRVRFPLHVVVLDRQTLEPVSTEETPSNWQPGCSTDGSTGPPAACRDAIRDRLREFGDGRLVIVQSVPDPAHGPYKPFDEALDEIGIAPEGPGDSFSAVGVTGLARGEGWLRTQVMPGSDPAALDGKLIRGPGPAYTFTWGAPTEFDTSASGTTPTRNVMQIGDAAYPSDPIFPGDAGFQLVAVDRRSGRVVGNRTWDLSAGPGAETDMAAYMNGIGPDTAVLVASFGRPGDHGRAGEDSDDLSWTRLAMQMERAGGLRDTFVRLRNVDRYALAGIPAGTTTIGQWPESSTNVTNGGNGRVHGLLTRDQNGRLTPAAYDSTGQTPFAMHQVAFQDATPFPWEADVGATLAAYRYLSRQADGGTDLRANYWLQPYSDAKWNDIARTLEDLAYPSGAEFSQGVFIRFRDQLVQEIRWLLNVRSYLNALASPFSTSGLSSWASLREIAQEVGAQVADDPNAAADAKRMQVVTMVVGLADKVSGGSIPVFSGAMQLYGIVDQFLRSASGAPPRDTFETTVADLGPALQQQMEESQEAFQQLGALIASDYGKLRFVGTNAMCSPSNPDCPRAWQWTTLDQAQAAAMAKLVARRTIYSSLLPTRYVVDDLPPDTHGRRVIEAGSYACMWQNAEVFPLAATPGTAQSAYFDDYGDAEGNRLMVVLRKGTGGASIAQPAPAGLLDPLWAPADPINPNGGLGLTKQHNLYRIFGTPIAQDCFWLTGGQGA